MKRKYLIIAGLIAAISLSGCATVQKKFTRKKKEPAYKPSAVYIEEGPYQKKYSNDYYYKTHYTFWSSWHSEMLNQLNGNRKRLARAAQETIGHLTEMNQYLQPEKQAELKPYYDSMSQICKRLGGGTFSDSEKGGIRTELERMKRIISSNFYYDKIKASLVSDKVDLGS